MSLLNPKRHCRDCGKLIDDLTYAYNHGRCDECESKCEEDNR